MAGFQLAPRRCAVGSCPTVGDGRNWIAPDGHRAVFALGRDDSRAPSSPMGRQWYDPVMNLGAPELIILLAIVLLLFGSTKVPKLARSLGHAKREFKEGLEEA